MVIQYIIVGLCVIAAVAFIARRLYSSSKGRGCGGGCSKCSGADSPQQIVDFTKGGGRTRVDK